MTKRFGAGAAVDRVSFDVAEGETLVLLGTSGSGKTTTLRMLNRLVEPDEGEIRFDGQRISEKTPETLRRGIGYVIQHTGLFPHYTVAQNIAVVPRLLGWDAARIRRRVEELVAMLRLPEGVLGQYPAQLSGGQQQRVGLARALAADPPVLLMDEPFGALDPVTRAEIRREFKTLEALRRKTIVLVTHDVPEAFELADRIGLMDKGQMQQLGTPTDFLRKPANAFVRDFLTEQRPVLQTKALKLKDLLRPETARAPTNDGQREWPDEASLWDVWQQGFTPTIRVRTENGVFLLETARMWEKLF